MGIVCKQTCGDYCCTDLDKTLTVEEAGRLTAAAEAQGLTVTLSEGIWNGLVTMTDRPCPFYQNSRCSIHAERPLVCKMYHCNACGTPEERVAVSRETFKRERNSQNGWIRFEPPD